MVATLCFAVFCKCSSSSFLLKLTQVRVFNQHFQSSFSHRISVSVYFDWTLDRIGLCRLLVTFLCWIVGVYLFFCSFCLQCFSLIYRGLLMLEIAHFLTRKTTTVFQMKTMLILFSSTVSAKILLYI